MDEIRVMGMLTAQGYMLELLLGAQVKQGIAPYEKLELVRAALDTQMRSDMRVPPTDKPHLESFLEIQALALVHLHEMLDRVKTRLAKP